MTTNFRLRLTLATPFYCTDYLTLDALLSAAVFNATGLKGDDTLPLIPLESEEGIFRGSSLFCAPGYRHAVVGRVMSLKSEKDLSTALFKPNRRGGQYGYIDQARGDYKANMSAYPGIDSREVFFWGVGDPEKAAALISDFIPGIGKRSNAGAGQILAVDWTEMDADYSWVTKHGLPARPLPKAVWEKIGGSSDVPVAPIAVRLPYWETERVEAVFPQSLSI